MAAMLRSGARRVAARAMLQPVPVAGALLQRAQAAGLASASSLDGKTKMRLIEELQYVQEKEIRMLENLKYKDPISTPAYDPTPAQPASSRASVVGAIAVVGGIGWYALAGRGTNKASCEGVGDLEDGC